MEKLVNKYPYIISDFSQLIKFSFNETQNYFKQKIDTFESEYYFLINPNSSLLVPNSKLGAKNKIIDEIINIAFNIKSKHSSSKVKLYTYKKYVKEIVEINEEDDTDMDRERICDLLIKEVDSTPKSDIITSLSNLYTKIEKSLTERNKKPKILKIILINNEMEQYKKILEKKFNDEKLKSILDEFVNEKSYFFGVELKYLDDRLMRQKRAIFEKISDFPTGKEETINNELKEKNPKIIKTIYISDELLKKSEKMSLSIYKKWCEIINDEEINNGIEKLDDIFLFYIDIMNSILFMKHKTKMNSKYRDAFVKKINYYISSENLNSKKNEILTPDFNETFMEDINSNKDKINEINLNSFIKQLSENKRYNNCICWSKIVNYLTNQKKNIIRFLDILQNASTFMELFEKEIIKKAKEIISDEKNDDEKDEDDEDNDDDD